jgi:DNA-binding beta-propeller fold protein YncE
MDARLDCIVSPTAEAVLVGLGRTEDVMFSPSGRRLAISGFTANRIAFFDVAIAHSAKGKTVVLSGAVEITASTLRNPHGLCFLDDETVAVANRGGGVEIYAVPASRLQSGPCVIQPRQTITGSADAPIRTPGSVASFPLGPDTLELLVCHNYSHVVTRHVLDRRRGYASVKDDVLLRRGLAVPDGICISPDGDWIAVSNHDRHQVLLYRRAAGLQPDSPPDAVLRNVICPHGVRFTGDQRHVLVADAHARYVNVYERGIGGWQGVHDPCGMAPVLDWPTYLQGRSNPEEGGPKGIDIDAGMNVLACTTEFQTLAFFDLAEVLRRRARPENRLLRYVQWRLARAIHRRKPELYGWLLPVLR